MEIKHPIRPLMVALLVCAFLGIMVVPTQAYVGPGAGFAVLGSFAAIIGALFLSIFTLITWPFIWLFRLSFRLWAMRKARYRRVIILGLDGVSPRLLENMMEDGRLPHFTSLAEKGRYTTLRTTHPPISPVAWSTFQTGVNPGKHSVFDFVRRAPGSYDIQMAFSEVTTSRKTGQAVARNLRRSVPFWTHVAKHGVPAAMLRVPVTFPCDAFRGWCLAAMGVPDLRGTQGSYTVVSDAIDETGEIGDGIWIKPERAGNAYSFVLPGPPGEHGDFIGLEMSLQQRPRSNGWELSFKGVRVLLEEGRWSGWVPVSFRKKRVRGMIQLLLRQSSPTLHLYISPVNMDPVRPAMPISWPKPLAFFLAKRLGRFSTLGICEDMSAVNDGALTKEEFHAQTLSVHSERCRQWHYLLSTRKIGLVGIVFDTPDRLQHMFWREGDQPEEMFKAYEEFDRLLGETLVHTGKKDLLIVLSDHGFADFTRSFSLNAWLRSEGYLSLTPDGKSVDWQRTRAYGLGLCGLFINMKGREPHGSVDREQAAELAQEIRSKLLAVDDGGKKVFSEVYSGRHVYTGPYTAEGPDLVLGYNLGYRVTSRSAVMDPGEEILFDNREPWQADHCIDRQTVPGILLCNQEIASGAGIEDISATVLEAFGLPVPKYMDGRSLLGKEKR